MKKVFILFFIITLTACKSSKSTAPTTPADTEAFVIENLASLNAEQVKKAHANANIKEDVGVFDEGTEELHYTILYPETPDEIQITWKDSQRNQINDIRFTTAGKWKSNSGIQIGTTYEELNALNEKLISFYGFGWDYSGAVMWNDGKLEDSKLRVFLAPEKEPKAKYYGDHIIEASSQEIKDMRLKVQTIIYHM